MKRASELRGTISKKTNLELERARTVKGILG